MDFDVLVAASIFDDPDFVSFPDTDVEDNELMKEYQVDEGIVDE